MTYHFCNQTGVSCDKSCGLRHLNCAAELHGYTEKNVFRIVESLIGEQVQNYEKSPMDLYSFRLGGPKFFRDDRTVRRWKTIPVRINCGREKGGRNVSLICPCVTGKTTDCIFFRCTKLALCCTKVVRSVHL